MSLPGASPAPRARNQPRRAGTRGVPRAEREQQILAVAGGVFARAGFHSASMDEIARLADVSKPMLYAYFASKEGLYVAYIERTGEELVQRLQPAFVAAAEGPLGRVDEFLRFVEGHRDGWRVLFSEASASRPVADQVAGLRHRITDAVRGLVQVGLPPGLTLPEPAADAVAHAIVGTGESLANWWLDHPDVPRQQVAGWYAGVIRASVGAMVAQRH